MRRQVLAKNIELHFGEKLIFPLQIVFLRYIRYCLLLFYDMKKAIHCKIDRILDQIVNIAGSDRKTILKNLKQAEKLAIQSNYRLAEIYIEKGNYYNSIHKHNDSEVNLKKAEELLSNEKDNIKYAQCLSLLGQAYYWQVKPDLALDYFRKALKIQEKRKELRGLYLTLVRLSVLYNIYFKEQEKSIAYGVKAYKIAKKLKNQTFEGRALGCIGSSYQDNKKPEKALKYFLEAKTIFEKLNNRFYLGSAYMEIGEAYCLLRKFREAEDTYLKLEQIGNELKHPHYTAEAAVSLGIIYFLLKDYNKFRKYYKLGRFHLKKMKDFILLRSFYKEYAEAFFKLKDYRTAYTLYKEYQKHFENHYYGELERKTKELKISFEKERAEKESEIHRLRSFELKRELESKTKELNLMASYLVKKNDFVTGMMSNVNRFVRNMDIETPDKARLNEFLKIIESGSKLNKDIVGFEENLNKINLAFTDKLARKFPALSPIELKICSLLKINLSTKEIAKLLFISHRTVENHRHRIILKLKLPHGRSLSEFINSL